MGIQVVDMEGIVAAATTPGFWLALGGVSGAVIACYMARRRISQALRAIDAVLKKHPSVLSGLLVVGALVSTFHHSFVPMLIQFIAAAYFSDKALEAKRKLELPQWRDSSN